MPTTDKIAMSVPEASTACGVGRSLLYEEIKAGRLKIHKVGTRTIITTEDLREWLASKAR